MSITARIDNAQLARLKAAIQDTGRELRKELAIAVRETAKKSKSLINKNIRDELKNVLAKDINYTIKVNVSEGTQDLTANVEVKKVDRISLKQFKPKQNKGGVSYQISKSRGGQTILGAFISEKLYGHVFKRVSKKRLKILKLFGPSPWGVFTVGKKIGPSADDTEAELKKRIDRRIRFLLLKKSGTI